MTLSYILFVASALIWLVRRVCRRRGMLLPFFSVLLCCMGVLTALWHHASLLDCAGGVMLSLLAAVILPEGGADS